MDAAHSQGVLAIQHLQQHYRGSLDFLSVMSAVGDPRNTFLLYFPIWFHLSRRVGTRMIWVAVIGDWCNLILKWVMFGQRPYWWVQETSFYQGSSVPHLEQFPITCETGPGSPSGHAMGSACVWYVMVTAILTHLKGAGKGTSYRLAQISLWSLFWVIQISVCVSRVFVATHFPHQVILGVLAGMLVAEAFNHTFWIYNASGRQYSMVSLVLFLFALGFYLLLKLIDVDLLWSVEKATKWCATPDWIHMDTMPFAGLYRNLGALFGLGLAVNSRVSPLSHGKGYAPPGSFKALCVILSLFLLYCFDQFSIPTRNPYMFYALSFCKCTAIPLTVVTFVPYCVQQITNSKGEKAYV
ncbi:glucose-6-phosphatase 2-like [Ambystoma mexicanum]|uniref:glucose-6-phosphatase 2-like n=1 Tax=Ambystoma mexicanum TaxID=8296 RepID=UPI0037E7B60D